MSMHFISGLRAALQASALNGIEGLVGLRVIILEDKIVRRAEFQKDIKKNQDLIFNIRTRTFVYLKLIKLLKNEQSLRNRQRTCIEDALKVLSVKEER